MLWHVVALQQWRARGDGAGGEILGQLGPDGRIDDEPVSVIRCSTWPRMSAAFHADRFAPNRDTTSSTAWSRLIEPTVGDDSGTGVAGSR